MVYAETYSKHIQKKAARFVDEHRVFESFRTREYSRFIVEGDRSVYHVYLWTNCTLECSCSYWTYQRKFCSHILACQLYHNPARHEVVDESEPKLSLEEIKQIVANFPDLFDPETWK